jgi:hypothetical protein
MVCPLLETGQEDIRDPQWLLHMPRWCRDNTTYGNKMDDIPQENKDSDTVQENAKL